MTDRSVPFDRRRAGVLLHPTSLPGRWGVGDLGEHAYRFVDWLECCGQTIWQMLPLGPTHGDRSPYQCLSLHAGNPMLISIDGLIDAGWLCADDVEEILQDGGSAYGAGRHAVLNQAFHGFEQHASADDHEDMARYVEANKAWLDEYALYNTLRKIYNNRAWCDWPKSLRERHPAALRKARARYREAIQHNYFEQFIFHRQWQRLRHYANERGILIFGDMPIFVAYDSADVWAQREYFQLDREGSPTVVAGVPPDYFSATGQRWGNPHYRWEAMERDGFQWWIDRVDTQLRFFDLVRIDHFRGFEAYWEIPVDHETAMDGRWVKAPGLALFTALKSRFGSLPLVAEDLGMITDEVHALREQFNLPGMKILQFAFEGGAENPYLPHNHEILSVIYTGTHDNDTTLGWWQHASSSMRDYVMAYLGRADDPMPWPLVRSALASVACIAVVPMQDIMMLGSEHRMNIPGSNRKNWRWRFSWDQLSDEQTGRLQHLTGLYGRR